MTPLKHTLVMPRCFGLLALLLAATLALPGCGTNRLQQERDALYEQNQELQDRLNRARSAMESAEMERLAALEELEAMRNQPAPAAPVPADDGFGSIEGVETFRDAGSITVRVPGDVLFAPGKVTLKSASKRTLGEIVDVIRSEYPSKTIRIDGHTDTDPIRKSKWADNLELSLQRAAAVHRYLEERGIPADRMFAAGWGETRPQATKAQSRRVEIVVVLQD